MSDSQGVKNKIKIFFFFIRQFRMKFLVFFAFSFFLSLTQNFLVAALYPFISFSLDQSNQAESGFVLSFLNNVVSRMPFGDPLFSAGVLLIVLAILQGIFRYLSVWAALSLSYNVTYNLQKTLYEKVIYSDLSHYISKKQGDLVFQIKDPPIKVGSVIRWTSVFIRETLIAFFLVLMMLSINVKLTILMLVGGGIFAALIKALTQKNVYAVGRASTRALGEEDVILSESLSGIYTIKAFFAEQEWVEKFQAKVKEFIYFAQKTQLMKEAPVSILEALVIILIAVSAIIFKTIYADSFVALMPVFAVFAASILKIIPSFRNISNAAMDIVSLFYNMEICYKVLHEPIATIGDGTVEFREFKRSIDFKDVSFAYPGHPVNIFDHLSLSFPKNAITAIVGRSGSGKTTLVNLLLRFYDPAQGRIEVDGMNLKELRRSSWLSKIGYVSQDPFIFHASIEENIRFGNNYTRQEVAEAARQAGAHSFIMNFKDGYQTMVGEKGMKLSGGEKQRLAIARALLRRPQILIFDEATSALDAQTEELIQRTIKEVASLYTVIIIAHRLSTVRIAHNILAFDQGKLIEQGSHDQLLKANNYYSRLYALNLGQ